MSLEGNQVAFSTFKGWGIEEIISHKTENEDRKCFVNFVYCKVCMRNKEAISSHPMFKGEARKAMLLYIEGTAFVTKHTIQHHIGTKAHNIAVEAERAKPQKDCILVEVPSGYSQPQITTFMNNTSTE